MPPPLSEKIPRSLANHTKDTVALGIAQNLKKSVLPADKKGIFNTSAQIEDTEATINSDRDWEISDKTGEISVRERLKENSHFWKNELKPSLFVQNIIDNGYIMPFITIPPSFYAPNNKSSLRNSRFVSQAISKLLKNKYIEELDQKPYCCNPLTVAESKKLRLVLDLRHVNSFIKQNKFRYEYLATLSDILSEGDYFTTFDLSSGYHHIEIHPEHRKFFGFEWTFEDGSTKYFHFCVLPFGLSSACYVFTKVLRPFTKRWRGIGIRAIIYIDDGIPASRSFELAKTAGELVKNDLVSAGFVINVEKSDFNPKTKGKWLGTIIETIEMTFTVPSEKTKKLLADIKNVLMQNVLTPKRLTKITGQLPSMHLAIGPLVRLFTRNMYHEIENRTSWCEPKIISKEKKGKLEF